MNLNPDPFASHASTRTALWLAGLVLLCSAYFLPRYTDWDQNSRFDLALALATHGTVAIDNYHWNTGDIDYAFGHYYSIMAPGQALSAVPLAWTVKTLVEATAGRNVGQNIGLKRTWRTTYGYYVLLLYLECVLTAGIPATLLVLLFFWFLGYFSESLWNRALLSLAFGLGTMIFPYAQVMYSHVPATALLFAAFVLLYVVSMQRPPRGPGSAWLQAHPAVAVLLAGLAMGAAEVYEYPAAVIGILLFAYAAVTLPRRYLPWIVLGALPGIIIVGVYDLVAYHNPFLTGYSGHSVLWKGKLAHGIGGSTWPPSWSAIQGLTISHYRGLFFLSPMLLLAFPGIALWAKRGGHEWLLFLSIPVFYTLAISTSPFWFAGSTVGPRYLIPVLPFLCVPIILVLEEVRRGWQRLVVYCLMVVSALNVWVQTLGAGGYPRETAHDPLLTVSLPGFLHDHLPLNLGSLLLAPVTGAYSKATLIPLACILGLWTYLTSRRIQADRREKALGHEEMVGTA